MLLMTAATGAWADETPKVVFEEHFVSEPNDPTAVGFYEFINFEEGDDHEVDNGELSIFNSDGTLDINNWKRRAIKFRNLPLGEGKTYRLEFKLKGSTRFEDGINDGDDRPFCKASAQLLQGVEGHDISLLDSDGNEQRGEFENFDESNYKSYSMTFVFASEQKQKDTYALNNQGELAEKYYLSLSIFNPGFFYLKDVVLYEIPSAASGYTVTLKDGVKDADKWTISPNPAEEGQTVTLQYTGRLKVKGVTATSDAAPAEATPALSLTNPTVGQVIGSDGKNYDAAASVPSGVDKVAMIAYVSGSNGLAIALADEGEMNWATAKSTCEAKTPAFTNGTWKLPTQDEWKQMFSANGGSEDSYNGLNTAITTAGGTVLQVPNGYWSSTPNGPQAYYVYLDANKTDWRKKPANFASPVRACLAFTVEQAKPAAMPMLTLGEMTQGGDPLNNGSGSETYFSPTFKEGDQIALVHGGVKDVVTVGKPNPDGSAPITGDITVGADNEDIVLVYPADLVAVAAGGTAYTENATVTNKFKTQAGTLAYIQNNLDIRKGTGKLAVSGASASLKANVSMASQIAIWKLTMTGGGGMIMAQKVTVKVGGNKVAEASTSGTYFAYPIDIYLALNPATMGTGTLRIEADEFGTIYYYQKDGGVSLTAGKFYQSAVELKR